MNSYARLCPSIVETGTEEPQMYGRFVLTSNPRQNFLYLNHCIVNNFKHVYLTIFYF